MKSLNQFNEIVKTKVQQSSINENVWIARSAVGFNIENEIKPMFGFGSSLNSQISKIISRFELLEHLVFQPSFYAPSLNDTQITYHSNHQNFKEGKGKLSDFMVGSEGLNSHFYGNGCAVSTNYNMAITHSKRELIERHVCCEIWYKQNRILTHLSTTQIKHGLSLNMYGTQIDTIGEFSLSVLECKETNFYGFGSAIKDTLNKSMQHASNEVMMIYDDAFRNRVGACSSQATRDKILSLRDICASTERKIYFNYILLNRKKNKYPLNITSDTIIFEPIPKLYAARSFSGESLDPRQFDGAKNIPILPLF